MSIDALPPQAKIYCDVCGAYWGRGRSDYDYCVIDLTTAEDEIESDGWTLWPHGIVECEDCRWTRDRLRDVLTEIRHMPHGERDEAVCAICVAVNRGLNPAEPTEDSSSS